MSHYLIVDEISEVQDIIRTTSPIEALNEYRRKHPHIEEYDEQRISIYALEVNEDGEPMSWYTNTLELADERWD